MHIPHRVASVLTVVVSAGIAIGTDLLTNGWAWTVGAGLAALLLFGFLFGLISEPDPRRRRPARVAGSPTATATTATATTAVAAEEPPITDPGIDLTG